MPEHVRGVTCHHENPLDALQGRRDGFDAVQHLDDQRMRLFDQRLERGEEFGADSAIHGAMIDRQSHGHHGGDGKLTAPDHGALFARPHGKDA